MKHAESVTYVMSVISLYFFSSVLVRRTYVLGLAVILTRINRLTGTVDQLSPIPCYNHFLYLNCITTATTPTLPVILFFLFRLLLTWLHKRTNKRTKKNQADLTLCVPVCAYVRRYVRPGIQGGITLSDRLR